MTIDDVCLLHVHDDCHGCPFADIQNCREWVKKNKADAKIRIEQYVNNGFCVRSKEEMNSVGKTIDGKLIQVCRDCFEMVYVDPDDIIEDSYTNELTYVCPKCGSLQGVFQDGSVRKD